MANEKRLVDANALMKKAYWHGKISTHGCLYPEGSEAVDVDDIDNAPTVDAVEVAHGRWFLLAEFFDGSICTECSVCGEEYTYKKGRLEHIGVEYAKYNYCPNCGAKMDGDGNG